MIELTEDRFYQQLRQYPDCRVDYCLLKSEKPDRGEISHREAVQSALQCLSRRERVQPPWRCDESRMSAVRLDAAEFLAVPVRPWKEKIQSTVLYHSEVTNGPLTYWYAFLEPPHGTGKVVTADGRVVKRAYTAEDFRQVNRWLFPLGTEQLAVYEWSTDWSDYFDDGHEWWGAGCWSVYDGGLERYAVIMASETD